MIYDEAIQRILEELSPPEEIRDIIQPYLQMIYTIGFEEGVRSRGNPRKPVFQMDNYGMVIAEYESAALASRKTRIQQRSINRCCNGELNQTGGFHWRYRT